MGTTHIERQPPGAIVVHLADDHARMDRLCEEVCRCVDDGELERAEHTFAELSSQLRAHHGVEEKILYPLYEARAWREARATQVLRYEHRSIEETLERMGAALAEQDVARFRDGFARLHAILPIHHLKEEQVLYAAIDGVLSGAERDELVRRLGERSAGHPAPADEWPAIYPERWM
jgi:hemerythrin-like domain-containing protein